MLRQRRLGSSTLVLLAYLIVNTLVILSNPPKYVTRTTDYVGAPIGDLSDAVRIQLAGKVTDGSYVSEEVQWEPDVYACGFSYNWYSIHGALGNKYTQNEGLCVRSRAVDFYSFEGVDTMSPQGMEEEYDSWHYQGYSFSTYRSCGVSNTVSHYFEFGPNMAALELPEDASARDLELLLYIGMLRGIHELAYPWITCDEPEELSPNCTLRFDFNESLPHTSEIRTSTVDVRSGILGELERLAGNESLLTPELSTDGMETGICEAVAPPEELIECDITCDATYPYPSSSCTGTYEVKLVKEVAKKHVIIAVMAVVSIACWLLLSTLRLGMRTAHGRSPRGYLGPGGSSQHFFEQQRERGDRVNLANPAPVVQLARISTDGTTFCPFSGSGPFPFRGQGEGQAMAGLGIVVCEGVTEIPREVFSRTRNGSSRSSSKGGTSIRVAPICFIARENPDGFLKNLDVEEVHQLLGTSSGRALLDESFGGDHLAWARGFSVVDALGCVLTLWTVHFVAANSGWGSFYWVAALVAYAKWLEEADAFNLVGIVAAVVGGVRVMPKNRKRSAPPLPITLAMMEVLYDLSVPRVELLGLCVTALWTAIIAVSCGYFILVLGYEPIYTGGGLFSQKVSLATALAVGEALSCPFALAGDWVRGSRCGDIGGRLAVSFCLASPQNSDGVRVSHVTSRSELHTTLETAVICGDWEEPGRA